MSSRSGKAEPRGDCSPASDDRTAWVSLIRRDSDRTAVPRGPRVRVVTDLEELVLGEFAKPSWASAAGRDRFGLWAEFEVPAGSLANAATASHPRVKPGVVTQRLRWIPPGRFEMGSPEDEPGRWPDEGPQRLVTIPRGFWLFDTPCTQALWEAVVGDKPSYFQSPTRPVEQVSWEDCQRFTTRMAEMMAGLRLGLPSEAEWEYACRAATTTAIYVGPVEIIGDGNAPLLDRIAWYGGNCGVDFELANGVEVTWLTDKQHEFKSGGTHPVAQKRPNPWGLYDMLGNVWEWCDDGGQASSVSTRNLVPHVTARRVVRGGSWLSNARDVRAACRHSYHPGNRDNYLGFRCRVQECELKPEESSVRDVASAERRSRKAKPGGDSDATSGVSHADQQGGGLLGRMLKWIKREK